MKVIRDIVEIHNMRAKLHQTVYQHHTANVAELMITDVLKLACDFKFRGDNGEPTTLADAALDPISFAQLTDSIIEPIWLSLDPEMKPARELYARILNRNFYKQIGGAFKICHLPLCPNRKCREPTPVHAKFCFNCGAKCTSREHTGGREDGQTDEEYPGVPLLLHKSAEDFKADILEHVKEDLKEHVYKHSHEVAVHLVIITHGKVSATDATLSRGERWLQCAGSGVVGPPLARPRTQGTLVSRCHATSPLPILGAHNARSLRQVVESV
eukprot:scaffold149435_cov31-Tisochrysis_lutea.AAC.2